MDPEPQTSPVDQPVATPTALPPPEPTTSPPIASPTTPPPPAWAEVRTSPEFAALSPEKKLVSFARWHDDAFNHAASLPDWEDHKDEFNNLAAQTQEALSTAAGGLSPDQARVQIATQKLGEVKATDTVFPNVEVDQNRNPREVARDTLRSLGPDVYRAYLNSHQLPPLEQQPTLAEDLAPPTKPGETSISAAPTIGGELKAGRPLVAATMAYNDFRDALRPILGASERQLSEEKIPWGKNADGSTHYEYRPLGGGPDQLGLLPGLAKLAFIGPRDIMEAAGRDPQKSFYEHKVDDSTGLSLAKGTFNAAQGLLQTLVSPGLWLGFGTGNAARAVSAGFSADMLHQVTPQLKAAQDAKNPGEFVQNLLGAATTLVLGVKAGEHAVKGTPATFGPTEIAASVKDMADPILQVAASAPELQQISPKVHAAVVEELAKRNLAPQRPSDLLANVPPEAPVEQASKEAVATVDEGAAQVQALQAANAPETAAAVTDIANAEASGQIAAAAAQPAPPAIRLVTRQGAGGEYTHNLTIAPETTVEQLRAWEKAVLTPENLSHLPEEAQAALREQVTGAIALREADGAPTPAQPTIPRIIPAEGETAPLSQSTGPHVVSTAINTPEGLLTGATWNEPHEGIGIRHGLDQVPQEQRGFIVQDAAGNQRFATRAEAGAIAKEAFQTRIEDASNLQSANLTNTAAPTAADSTVISPFERALVPAAATRAERDITAPEVLKPATEVRPLPGEVPKPPSASQIAREAATPRTPEEKAAKIEQGRTEQTQLASETGIVPLQRELHSATGSASEASKLGKELREQLARDFPSQTVPEGSRETAFKNPLTGDQLPSVIDAEGRIRPKFTNDPTITAQQLDLGQRVVVPAELLAPDNKINPAITLAVDKATGEKYVLNTEVKLPDGRVEKISGPDEFTQAFKDATAFEGRAQKALSLDPETLQGVKDKIDRDLKAKGIDFEPLEFDLEENPGNVDAPDTATIPGEAETGPIRDAGEGLTTTVLSNVEALNRLGLNKPSELANPMIVGLKQIAGDQRLPAGHRILAKRLLQASVDWTGVKLRLNARPLDDTAGLYQGGGTAEKGTITLNTSVRHKGGVAASLLHEAVHHLTLRKMDPDYKRSTFEQKAYDSILRYYDKALKTAFEKETGRQGNEDELATFAKAQGGDKRTRHTQKSEYYALTNPREFIAETLSSTHFQEFLSKIEGEAGVKGKLGNLLNAIRDSLKQLFNGQPVNKGSLLDNALEDSYKLLRDPQETSRIGTGRARAKAEGEDVSKLSRIELEQRYTEKFGEGGPDITLFSTPELRDALKIETSTAKEPTVGAIPDNHYGWLDPKGKFHEADFEQHDAAAREIIKEDPKIRKAFEKAAANDPTLTDESGSALTEFMKSQGFIRVVGGPGNTTTYIQGNPTRSQLQMLKDAALTKGSDLIQETGTKNRTLFSPADAFQKAEPIPQPTLTHEIGPDGKIVHGVEIPPEVPHESLIEALDRVDKSAIPDADKTRIKEQIGAEMKRRVSEPQPSGPANARVDAQRAARGLAPRMEPLRRALGVAWTEAMKRVEDDPTAGTKLIKDVNSPTIKKGTLSDTEIALLAHEQVRRENEFDNAVDAVNDATPEALPEAKARLDAARDAIDEVYRATERSGTLAGQSLAARRILVNSDLTLARMEANKRAANDGKPLTEDQLKQVKTAFDEISALKERLDVIEGQQAAAAEEALLKKLEGAKRGGNKAEIAKAQKALEKKARVPLTDEQLLERYKKSLATRLTALQAKIDAGDFSKNVRQKTKLDQEALDAQAAYKRAREAFDRGVERDRARNRPLHERALDTFADFVRGIVISSPVAYGKLLAAAFTRLALTPAEETAGAVLRQIPGLKRVAALAPREGGSSVKAEARAITQGFMLGMKDTGQIIKTGRSDLDVLYGRPDIKPRGALLEFIGRTHYAMKAIPMRAEFERSMELRTQHAMANGADVTDPMVRMQIALDSYKDAGRSIFKANNRVVDAYKAGLAGLERKNSATGKTPIPAKVFSTFIKSELPVVGVPTNIVSETAQFVFGSISGSLKFGKALASGIEKLSPEEADQIMRHLKKGSIGAAAMALAFFAPPQEFAAGGFYEQGEKRKKSDLEPESLRVYGQDIPKQLLHNPLYLAMQVAATARRAADEHLHRGGKEQGIGGAALAGLFGLGEAVPFVKVFEDIHKAFDPNTRPRLLAEMLKSDTIPQAVQWVAKKMDEDAQGKIIKRTPSFKKGIVEGTKQTLKTGIPVLRNEVPKSKK